MKPITLPTSEEARARLFADGWELFPHPDFETWCKDDAAITLCDGHEPYVADQDGGGTPIAPVIRFASILGVVETPQTPAGDASKLRQYGLALAAMQAGVFPYPENDEGKRWTHIVRIPLFALPDDERRTVLRRLYTEPNQRAESEWFTTPIEALAAAADAMGLAPIPLTAETPQGVTVPLAPVQEWLAARDAFETGNRYAWEKKQRYYDASNALDTAMRAALSGIPSSVEMVPMTVVESAFRSWCKTANEQVEAIFIDSDKAWGAIVRNMSAGSSQVDGGE